MKGKKKCEYCGKMYKAKGLHRHERFCVKKSFIKKEPADVPPQANSLETATPVFSNEYIRGREDGLSVRAAEVASLRNDVKIKAIDAVAQAISAMAMMVDTL